MRDSATPGDTDQVEKRLLLVRDDVEWSAGRRHDLGDDPGGIGGATDRLGADERHGASIEATSGLGVRRQGGSQLAAPPCAKVAVRGDGGAKTEEDRIRRRAAPARGR